MNLALSTIGGRVVIKLVRDRSLIYSVSRKHTKNSRVIIEAITKALESMGQGLSDLSAVIVVNAGGRFSELRAGVVVANALGYALSIPVMGVDEAAFADLVSINVLEEKYIPVQPLYARDPNIG